ncbi:MAG: (2Fe-2S) ferredoxin domain-containing protein [Desulfobacterota bacterium]|nr:(2Fe-2S) ferredoxin domain-containing protein [Thermodesulfobacteriota bacterium]
MPKMTLEDLKRIKEEVRASTMLREGGFRAKITIHMGTCGIAAGARKVMSAALKAIEDHQVRDVMVTTSGCAGLCSREPMATVEILGKPPVKYCDLNEEKMKEIFASHILKGEVVESYALARGSETTY